MAVSSRILLVRVMPVLMLVASAIAYVAYIEGRDSYVFRNVLPMLFVAILAAVTLILGDGRWTGAGWKWPLGTIGFAVPAMGLSLYLHFGYATDLDGMVSSADTPTELFRYLPIYTLVAGVIGFTIGWIAGRNV